MAALDERDEEFADCYVLNGDLSQAARLSARSARNLGSRELRKPQILAAYLMKAAALRAAGQWPHQRAMLLLRKVAPKYLATGVDEHGIGGLPPVAEAYRQFRLALGLDGRRVPMVVPGVGVVGGARPGGAAPSPEIASTISTSPQVEVGKVIVPASIPPPPVPGARW